MQELVELIFPPAPVCAACARPLTGFFRTDFCRQCLDRLVFTGKPYCARCGRPLASRSAAGKQLCYTCTRTEPRFRLSRSALVYTEEARALIHRFKYEGQVELGKALGRLMAARLGNYPELGRYKVVVPIPLHPETAVSRTFNQALILAAQVADKRNRRLVPYVLQRLPGSALQHTLSGRQRRQGLAGEFYVADPAPIKGRRILLIDDVLTTGSTLSEAARVLLRAGAKEVAGYTLAIGLAEKDGY